MKVFRVVVDSSCLIGLAQIEIFGLLKEVFAETYILNSRQKIIATLKTNYT